MNLIMRHIKKEVPGTIIVPKGKIAGGILAIGHFWRINHSR